MLVLLLLKTLCVLLTCAVTEGTGAVYSDVMFAVDVCCICY